MQLAARLVTLCTLHCTPLLSAESAHTLTLVAIGYIQSYEQRAAGTQSAFYEYEI